MVIIISNYYNNRGSLEYNAEGAEKRMVLVWGWNGRNDAAARFWAGELAHEAC